MVRCPPALTRRSDSGATVKLPDTCGAAFGYDGRPMRSERVDAREFPADRELVDRLGALVGDHALEVQRVADRHVLGTDAGAAEHVAAVARNLDRGAAVVPLGVLRIPPHTGRPAGSLPAALVRCNVSCVSRHFAYGYILQQDRHAAVCRYGRSGRTILSAGAVFHAVPICVLLCSLSLFSRGMRPNRIVTRLLSPVLHLS